MKNSITRAARPPCSINDCLLKVTLELRGQAKTVTCIAAYAPTKRQSSSNTHIFWTTLDRVVEGVLRHEQLFVCMDANAHAGRRENTRVGEKDNKRSGPYARDPLNDNTKLLLSFANRYDLALVNTFVVPPRAAYHINSTGENKRDPLYPNETT